MVTRTASHRCNGAGLHKAPNATASYIIVQHGAECNRPRLQLDVQDELAGNSPNTAESFIVSLPQDMNMEQEEKPEGPPVREIDGLQSSSLERSTEPVLHVP